MLWEILLVSPELLFVALPFSCNSVFTHCIYTTEHVGELYMGSIGNIKTSGNLLVIKYICLFVCLYWFIFYKVHNCL